LKKWQREVKQLKGKVVLFGITYFYDEKTWPALLEMYIQKERLKFKDFLPKRNQIVIDAGASLGDYTLIYSKLIGKRGKVITFEPNKKAFNLLLKNIEANKVSNVIALRMALWNEEGTISIKEGNFSTLDKISSEKENTYRVKAITLDSIVKKLKLKRVDLVKIDVEGAEVQVLKGSLETIRRFHPKIIVEVHEWLGVKSNEIMQLLKKYGYKLTHEYRINENTYELFLE